jgi:uncharacterized protein YndB with AHSA1/START domain
MSIGAFARRRVTMKKILLGLVGVVALIGGGMAVYMNTGTNVRQLTEHGAITPDGKAKKTRTADALDYAVGIQIAAPPEVVWALLTDAAKQKAWNSTLTEIEGPIELGRKVKLKTKTGGDRQFELAVTTLEAPRKMVWEDGGKPFMGVRTWSLTPAEGGTLFAMNETLSGRMLGMIEDSLPDFSESFEAYAADLKKAAEAEAPPPIAPDAAADAGSP